MVVISYIVNAVQNLVHIHVAYQKSLGEFGHNNNMCCRLHYEVNNA